MFLNRLTISLFEFLLTVAMSGIVIYVTYRLFIRANPDFDMEEEIKKGNTSVGVLVGAIMLSASIIMLRGLESVVSMFRMHLAAQMENTLPAWKITLLGLGHLALSLALAIFTISFTLRMFGKMTNKLKPDLRLGKELEKGNLAVGILLASVVLIAALYVGEGVSAVTKALVPQPSIGKIQIMR